MLSPCIKPGTEWTSDGRFATLNCSGCEPARLDEGSRQNVARQLPISA